MNCIVVRARALTKTQQSCCGNLARFSGELRHFIGGLNKAEIVGPG